MSSPMQQVPLLPQAGSGNLNPLSGQAASRGGSATALDNTSADGETEDIFGIAEDPVPKTVYVVSRGGDSSEYEDDYMDDPDGTAEADASPAGDPRNAGKAPAMAGAQLGPAMPLDIRDQLWSRKRKSATDAGGSESAEEETEHLQLNGSPKPSTAGAATLAVMPNASLESRKDGEAADKRGQAAKRFSRPDSNASLQDWYDWWTQALAEKHRLEAEGNTALAREQYPGLIAAWNRFLENAYKLRGSANKIRESATNLFASIFANP